jgi:hypothetical protein
MKNLENTFHAIPLNETDFNFIALVSPSELVPEFNSFLVDEVGSISYILSTFKFSIQGIDVTHISIRYPYATNTNNMQGLNNIPQLIGGNTYGIGTIHCMDSTTTNITSSKAFMKLISGEYFVEASIPSGNYDVFTIELNYLTINQ